MRTIRFSFLLFCFALILNSIASAKPSEFRVLASKGTVQVQRESGKNWDKLTAGATLNKNDKIKVAQKSFLSLVHSSGKTIEIKASGTYAVNDLSSKVSAMKANVSQRFANYVIDEMGSSNDMLAKGNYKENMDVTGSTERGMAHFNPKKIKDENQPFLNKDSYVRLNSPHKINFMNPEFTFTWHKISTMKEFEFQITDRFDKPVFTKTVSDTSITINANSLKLEKDVYYFWKVCLKNDSKVKSDDACFLVLSDKKITAIRDTAKLINEEMGTERTATSSIILASFYEQNYIIDEAIKSYKSAIELAPDVPEYQNLYKRFMKRISVSSY